MTSDLHCPSCGNRRLWKDGIRYTKNGDVQRYLCRSCGYRFSEHFRQSQIKVNVLMEQSEAFHSTFNLHNCRAVSGGLSINKVSKNSPLMFTKDSRMHDLTNLGKRLNNLPYKSSKHRVRASEDGAKNLVKVENRTEERAAGATKTDIKTIKGLIVQYAYWLEKEGYYKDSAYLKMIRVLVKRGANLLDPEDVKTVIAKQPWKNGTKMLAVHAYDIIAKILNIEWTKPKYVQEETLPFIPEEKELDQLIAACKSRRMATYLQTLKETFADPSEALRLRWTDTSGNVITINSPVKRHNPRRLKVSNKLIAMLNALPKTSELIFPVKYRSIAACFMNVRRRAAHNLQNPRLRKISLTTFRHWGATITYHYTRDILLVQKLLGHKHIQNTMKYTQLVHFEGDEFDVATATSIEEAKELLATGFDYVTEKNGIMLFRRPKRFSV